MIDFGISRLPPNGIPDEVFVDSLLEDGYTAHELPFVNDFPWKEKRCREFGQVAADRGLKLSLHAPYFAVLTVEEPDRAKQSVAALEHSMKLGKAMGAHTVVAHTGHIKERSPDQLHEMVAERLESIRSKVEHLGVALGLETAGKRQAFGSLGDIALIAKEFSFVRPVIDWAHVHAQSGGALTSVDAFASVIQFLRSEFPGWAIDPLHSQFTDNEFGPSGEIRHVPYGDGTLRSSTLAQASTTAGLRMIVISEAKDDASHRAIFDDLRAGESAARPKASGEARSVASGLVEFPDELRVEPGTEKFPTVGLDRPLVLSNVDKVFFPQDGFTKGDLLQYYAAIAPVLLPHLEHRALSMARYPDGAEAEFFYEKQCPSHAPEWLAKAPIHSEHRGDAIEFCTAPDLESLLWVVNLGCIEMHPWLSTVQRPLQPNFAIFDLDPAEGATWEQVVDVAKLVNVMLERLGLAGYPKTSGATGIHIYVPIVAEYEYKRVRKFVETVGRMIASADPANATMEWDIPKRAGKVFIDHNQNVAGKTIASVYSVRPRPGAPVSVPILWDELDDVHPDQFTIANVWPRLRQYGDIFEPALRGDQRLELAEGALGLTDREDNPT